MSIENIVNDIGWQPSSGVPIATLHIQIPTHNFILEKRETTDIQVVVRRLENGLLYAVALDKLDNNMPTFAQRGYPIENFPKGQSPYQLINLVRFNREDVPGFYATFEYKAGKTPSGLKEIPHGLDATRLEYTTWHNPVYDLTLLTSVQAHQLVKEDWLNVQLSLPTYGNSERAMTIEISSLGESLRFDKNGNLEKPVPRLFWSSKELEGIYQTISSGAQIDTLQTAVALINGSPSQIPLHMEKLIQYTSPIQRK